MSDKDEIIAFLQVLGEKQNRQISDVTDIKISQAKMEANFETHMKQDEQMKEELANNNRHLEIYNQELKVHIAGVQELKRGNDIREQQVGLAIEELKKRTEKLEAPRKFMSQVGKYIMDISKILVALATIGYILSHFHNFDLSHLVF